MSSKRKPSTKRATPKAPGRATKAARKATGARQAGKARTAAAKPDKGTARSGRSGTKQANLIAMLRGVAGATIAEIVAATGWQPHTVRGAISGALKKKLNLTIVSEKTENRGRVYRIAD